MEATREILEAVYQKYNRPDCIHPDPLELVRPYDDPMDREVAGIVAASLAYGRVEQILKSVSAVLDHMKEPASFLRLATKKALGSRFSGFKHRFADGGALCSLLLGVKGVRAEFGSLGAALEAGLDEGHDTVVPALTALVERLEKAGAGQCGHLLPDPVKGGACKRLHLYLRWMVRHDAVDPGGWDSIPPSKLVVPLDTHMHKIALFLGLTKRKSADARTALEITSAFRRFSPADPVRYDFALTRGGILLKEDPESFLSSVVSAT